MRRIVAWFVLGSAVVLLGCSEESRKAWVSVLPDKSLEEANAEESVTGTAPADTAPVVPRYGVDGDSIALSDTLMVHEAPRVLVSEPISDAWISWIEER